MSDEGFLKRWSRKKRAETTPPAAEAESEETPPSQASPAVRGKEPAEIPPPLAGEGREGARPAEDDDAIDPATLPPIESLGPDSDYTVFLKKGVPEALRIAALRKAWVSDPFIRDFRGPAEYAIDYTTAEFDLRPTDDVAKMLDRILPPQPAGEAAPAATAAPSDRRDNPDAEKTAPATLPSSGVPKKQAAVPEPRNAPELASALPPPRRKHGGALPDKGD